MDDFGLDGTQAPPPPRLFPDAVAGLVTGEAVYRPPPAGSPLSGSPPVRPWVAEPWVAEPWVAEPWVAGSWGAEPGARAAQSPDRRRQAQRRPPARHRPPPARGWTGQAAPQAQPQVAPAWQQTRVARQPKMETWRQPVIQGGPVAHEPYAPLASRTARPGTGPDRSGRNALAGCLVALAVLGGLLFTVLRGIIEAVVDLF